jgi:small subunit ribosomal protein S30e
MLMRAVFQVEPQEKKKTPKGRAKKRITYTRRFVNVTLTGGKRKVSGLFTKFKSNQQLTWPQMNPNPTS